MFIDEVGDVLQPLSAHIILVIGYNLHSVYSLLTVTESVERCVAGADHRRSGEDGGVQ